MRKKDEYNTYLKNTRPTNAIERIEDAQDVYTDTNEENEVELKNKNFLQVSKSFEEKLLELQLSEPVASAVLQLLAFRMENNNTYIIKIKGLADALCKSEKTIKRAIATLREKDFLLTFKINNQNVYFINPRVYCKVSASYKERLISEYVKIKIDEVEKTNIMKDEEERHTRLDLLEEEEKQCLKCKMNFSKSDIGKRLKKPSNIDIHKMNEIKEILNVISEEDFIYLLQKYKNE